MAIKVTASAGADNAAGPTRRDASDDEIAMRAHEIYMSRGGDHGHDFDDWIQARRELSPQHDAGEDVSDR